jgi:hypothetical protein
LTEAIAFIATNNDQTSCIHGFYSMEINAEILTLSIPNYRRLSAILRIRYKPATEFPWGSRGGL